MKIATLSSLILFIICISFTSCTKDPLHDCSNIAINISNHSGNDILNFAINEITWDTLTNGASILNICKDQLTMDGGIPLIYYTGLVNNIEVKSTAFLHFCGTEMYQVDNGLIHIKILGSNNWSPEILPYEYIIE